MKKMKWHRWKHLLSEHKLTTKGKNSIGPPINPSPDLTDHIIKVLNPHTTHIHWSTQNGNCCGWKSVIDWTIVFARQKLVSGHKMLFDWLICWPETTLWWCKKSIRWWRLDQHPFTNIIISLAKLKWKTHIKVVVMYLKEGCWEYNCSKPRDKNWAAMIKRQGDMESPCWRLPYNCKKPWLFDQGYLLIREPEAPEHLKNKGPWHPVISLCHI